jgi:hypothetical protein
MRTISKHNVDEMYKWSKGDLFTAYANPSSAKRSIWADLMLEVAQNGGHDLVVRSRNCMIFTAMYIVGMQLVVIYPTRREVYEIV